MSTTEYIVYLANPSETRLILAVTAEEAYQIARERWEGRVVQIVCYTPIKESGNW
jgi:hypothetical protein